MNNNELLLAISDMLDEKLNLAFDNKLNTALDAHDKNLTKTFDDKLDALNKKLTKSFDDKLDAFDKKLTKSFDDKLDALDKKLTKSFDDKLDALNKKLTKTFDDKLTPICTRLDGLEQRVLEIQITQENDILPRLQTIEDCYLSTYKRYEESCNKIDQMQKDIALHALVLEEHSEILKRIS